MRRRLLAMLVTMTLGAAARAASPCEDTLLERPGAWRVAASGSRTAPANFAVEKAYVALVRDMVHARFNPTGLDADETTSFVQERGRPFDTWEYRVRALEFFCDGGSLDNVRTGHEGSSSLTVSFNRFGGAELYEDLDDKRLLGFHTLGPGAPVEERPGVWRFPLSRESLGFGRTGKGELWLLTFEGKLPWSYVSREEFLVRRKRNLGTLMEEERRGLKSDLERIEQAKAFKVEEYKGDAAKLEQYLRVDYGPMRERYTKLLEGSDRPYLAAIAAVEAQLAEPAAALAERAIVKQDPHDALAYLFADAADPMARVLVKPNPAYFRKGPRHAVQMISVALKWDHEDPIAQKFHDGVTKALDIGKLEALVGTAAAPR